MASIFITGGSGFVGQNAISELVKKGHRIRALARSDEAARRITTAGGEPVRGDISSLDALTSGISGCEWVIHAAAKVEQWGSYEDFYQVNVVGTENVLAAAAKAGAKRFVHVGTEAGLVGERPLVNATEEFKYPTQSVGLYPVTKRIAEERVIAANRAELATMVVRPRFIWGKGDTSLLPQLIAAVKKGQFMWISGGHYLTSTCHVINVVEGIELALERGRPGNAYFLTDGEPTEFRAFITSMLETQGLEGPKASIPRPVAKVMAGLLESIWGTLHLQSAPPMTRTLLYLMGEEVTVSDAKARRELGYTASMTRERGLREMKQAREAQPKDEPERPRPESPRAQAQP
ncbi:MAG TPA: NAD-dependent epimerase/dehydratase family protein [Polyangiaceae bacterium]|nr:NAD-dependent epimerase/dehydratase family protein [Polyangiaceae bacterium]